MYNLVKAIVKFCFILCLCLTFVSASKQSKNLLRIKSHFLAISKVAQKNIKQNNSKNISGAHIGSASHQLTPAEFSVLLTCATMCVSK